MIVGVLTPTARWANHPKPVPELQLYLHRAASPGTGLGWLGKERKISVKTGQQLYLKGKYQNNRPPTRLLFMGPTRLLFMESTECTFDG